MATAIKLNEEHKEKLLKEFKDFLDGKMTESNVNFTCRLEEEESKDAYVTFTPEAYLKMITLVNNFEGEVGWYATAHREPNGEEEFYTNSYIIDDIILYKQKVSAVKIDSLSDEDTIDFYMSLDDYTAENLRCQGHSHVNFSTTPSGVDRNNWNDHLVNIKSGFYIFFIWNKRNEHYFNVYDFDENLFYNNSEIDVEVQFSDGSMSEFKKNANSLVKSDKQVQRVFGYPENMPAVSKIYNSMYNPKSDSENLYDF